MHKLILISGLSLCAAQAQAASQVACHYTYGGETKTLVAAPTASSYGVEPVTVGSYFLFRVVFEAPQSGAASVKIYTYADLSEGPSLVHQASYAHPGATRSQDFFGFTGIQRVYEPARDGEIQYWCEMQKTRSKP